MTTTDLGACEWFVWDLRRSNLIDRGQLDQVIGEFLAKNAGAEPPALAEYLVGHGILTGFQAERLLQGKTQGFVLGPFTLTDALGSGSMGTVYKAQSKTDSKWYAVKVLPRRSMWNVRIARRKVRAFDQCKHPAVVPFVDVGTSGGMHYLAWPLINGTPFDRLSAENGQLTPAQVASFALQIAEGLEQAHAADLLHGLLKPSNLMITEDNQVRILDFGIGCLLAETEGESLVDTMSTANSVNSGLDCSSPESIMDPTNLTPVGDQYSLGCVMYFLLTGQYPFPEGTAVEKMMSHQHKQPKPILDLNPEVPAELVAVVEKLMQKQPTMRYVNCGEAAEALRPFAQSAGALPPRRAVPVPRPAALRPEKPVAPPATTPTPNPVSSTQKTPINTPRPGAGSLPPRAPSSLAGKFPRPGVTPRPSAPGLPPKRLSAHGLSANRPSTPGLPPRPSTPGAMPRPSIAGTRPSAASAPPAPPPPVPVPEAAPEPAAALAPPPPVYAGPTLGQRLGNLGIIMLSILFGVLAYIASSMIKL